MKKNKRRIIKSLLGASASAALVGPAITMLNSNTEINVNDDVVIKDKETRSMEFELKQGLFAEDIPAAFGGSADFSATLGFVHSAHSGRGWSNMFWGNHWNFAVNNGSEQKYRDYGMGKQKSIAAERMTGKKFTYSDHRENLGDGSGYNTNAVFLNEGSLDSTLAYDNYEIQVERKDEGSGDPNSVYTSQLGSNFELGKDPDLMDDVSSSFLLLLYSMFITGESYKLTGDKTMDTSPEILFIEPVFQLTRNGSLNNYNSVSLASAVTAGLLGTIIGGIGAGPVGAIANGVGSALIGLFMPQMNAAGANGIKMALEEPDFIPIDGAKAFLWDNSVMLKNKYFGDESYNIDKFFITDISLNMNFETKLSYDGWHGWKPYAIMSSPSVSMSYIAEGTRVVTTATTYDYSQWLIEKKEI